MRGEEMKCPECGKELSEGVSFCKYCGSKIDQYKKQNIITNAALSYQFHASEEEKIYNSDMESKEQRLLKRKYLSILVAAVSIIILVSLVIKMYEDNKYICTSCGKKVSTAYYDPFDVNSIYCENCARSYFAPFDYEQYKITDSNYKKENNSALQDSLNTNSNVSEDTDNGTTAVISADNNFEQIDSTSTVTYTCPITGVGTWSVFSDGAAWVRYTDSNYNDCFGLINENGNILYSTQYETSQVTPVTDGLTVVYYTQNCGFTILNNKGEELYNCPSDDGYEFIAYGEGQFLIGKRIHTFDTEDFMIGTIDSNGNPIYEVNQSAGKYSNKGTAGYIGEGFIAFGGLYDLTRGIFLDGCFDNRIVNFDKDDYFFNGYYVMDDGNYRDVYLVSAEENHLATDHVSVSIIDTDYHVWSYSEGYWATESTEDDSAYYLDMNGNIAILPEYDGKIGAISPFSGGYGPLVVTRNEGIYDSHWATIIDSSGKSLYSPIEISGYYIVDSNKGYICAELKDYYGRQPAIIKPDGTILDPDIDNLKDLVSCSLKCDSYIIENGYFVDIENNTIKSLNDSLFINGQVYLDQDILISPIVTGSVGKYHHEADPNVGGYDYDSYILYLNEPLNIYYLDFEGNYQLIEGLTDIYIVSDNTDISQYDGKTISCQVNVYETSIGDLCTDLTNAVVIQ